LYLLIYLHYQRKVNGWCKQYIRSSSNDSSRYFLHSGIILEKGCIQCGQARKALPRIINRHSKRDGDSGYKASTTILFKLTGHILPANSTRYPEEVEHRWHTIKRTSIITYPDNRGWSPTSSGDKTKRRSTLLKGVNFVAAKCKCRADVQLFAATYIMFHVHCLLRLKR